MADKKINYIARSFVDTRTELFNYIRKYYPELFSDFSDSSVGTMLVELNAAIADMLSHHTDRMFQETQIDFAQKRSSLLNIARTMGVKIPGFRPSISLVDFSVNIPPLGDTPDFRYAPIIKYGTQVVGAGKVFENLEDIDFSTNFTFGGIPNRIIIPNFDGNNNLVSYTITKRELVVNGKTNIYTKSINVSDAKPFLEVVLPETNVLSIESIITLENNVGVPTLAQFFDEENRWYEVESLAEDKVFIDDNSRSSDQSSITPAKWKTINKRFVREYTDGGFCKLTFGSGVKDDSVTLTNLTNNKTNFINTLSLGEIPKVGTTMYIKYRVGGGSGSNLGVGVLTSTGNVTMEINGPNQNINNSVRRSLSVINNIPAVGGGEPPSTEELRHLIKYNFASQNRSVTIKDYVAQLLKMPGRYGVPFRWSVEERSNKIIINTLGLNFDGKLSNLSSNTMKENISTWLADYRMINDYVEINDGKVINIGLDIDIFVDKSFNTSEVVNNTIQETIKYFDIKNFSMGENIYFSDLIETINNIGGVLNVIDIRVKNFVGGNYSLNESRQNFISVNDTTTPIVYNLDVSDYTLFGEQNGMFEIKFPNRDIKVRVKTN
jgi:hypothetical protein